MPETFWYWDESRGGIERQLTFNPIIRFLFKLANEHHKPVSEVIRTYPSWELTAWAIFFKLQHEDFENRRSGKTVLKADTPEQEIANLKKVLGG